MLVEQLAHELPGCGLVPLPLHHIAQDFAFIIDSAPEILPLTSDRHKKLVQVPGVAQATLSPLELSSVLHTKLPRPLSDRLVGDDDSALSQEVFDISEAQTEAIVESDCVADDLGWKPVSVVARCFSLHRPSLNLTVVESAKLLIS